MVHGNVRERGESVAGNGSSPKLMGKEKREWIFWVTSERAKGSPYEEQAKPCLAEFAMHKKDWWEKAEAESDVVMDDVEVVEPRSSVS